MKFEKIAELKFSYKKETDPEKLAERDREIDQIKSDMEALKTKRVLEAKEAMQEEKRKVHDEKTRLLEDARNNFVHSRPNGANGANSAMGEPLCEYIDEDGEPSDLRINIQERTNKTAGSGQKSPKSATLRQDQQLLGTQELLKLQKNDSVLQQNSQNLTTDFDIAVGSKQSGPQRSNQVAS